MVNIRHFRQKHSLTQAQLAQIMGVSLDTISRYKTGKREPKASDLCKMAEIFDCTLDELVRPISDVASLNEI